MRPTRVHAVYFSPTGATRKTVQRVALAVAERLDTPLVRSDFTLPKARESHYEFAPDELVVFGTPTYAGKVPNKLLPFIEEGFSGNGALAVALVGFGNRAFDNSLAELAYKLVEDGFYPIAAGAFVARHAFSRSLASDRPDEQDLQLIEELADAVVARLEELGESEPQQEGKPNPEISAERSRLSSDLLSRIPGSPDAPYYRPIGLDGEPTVFLKAKPLTNSVYCTEQGVCARLCPMAAISFEDFSLVPGTCIKCHSCVRHCPRGAKYFDDPAFLSHRGMLERDYTRRADSIWLA